MVCPYSTIPGCWRKGQSTGAVRVLFPTWCNVLRLRRQSPRMTRCCVGWVTPTAAHHRFHLLRLHHHRVSKRGRALGGFPISRVPAENFNFQHVSGWKTHRNRYGSTTVYDTPGPRYLQESCTIGNLSDQKGQSSFIHCVRLV